MNRLHAYLAAAAMVCLGGTAQATPQNYILQGPTASTYSQLTGGTQLSFGSQDDAMATVTLPASLNFRWFGQPVTTIGVDTNGFIGFGSQPQSTCSFGGCYSTTSMPVNPGPFSTYPVDSLYVWWADMNVNVSDVSTGTETVNGVDTFVIDFNSLGAGSAGAPTGSSLSAKVRLYPQGSKIEVIYGPNQGSDLTSNAVVGVQNSDTGSAALYVAGLTCSTTGTCSSSSYPANQTITYIWADKPDLVWSASDISSVSAGPNTGDPVSVTVTGTVSNSGTQDQDGGAFPVSLYLSSHSTLDNTAQLLSSSSAGPLAIGQGQAVQLAGQFNRPAVGKYYFLLNADTTADGGLGVVDEIDEGNNTSAMVVYMGTDLTGTISAPDGGDVGFTVPVQVHIFNQGVDVPAVPFTFNIYLSTDNALDSSDQVVYTQTIDPTDGGLPYNQTLDITLPANVPASDVFWILQIDPTDATNPNGVITEADETNNVIATSNSTHANLPDLAVTAVEVRDTVAPNPTLAQAFFGEPVLLRVVVQNLGAATVRNAEVGVYLSGGLGASVITTHDQQLDDPNLPDLAPGGSITLDLTLTVPVNQPNGQPWDEGDFFFGAIADSTGSLGETNEGNNIGKFGPLHLRPPAPDFTPVHLDAPAAAAVGEVLPVFRVIRNMGNRGNTSPTDLPCPYRYYLSSNDIITTEDIPLQIRVGDQLFDEGGVKLDVDQDSRITDLVQLPANLAPGTYHLGILLNAEQAVPEIDFTNNSLDATSTVVVAGSTLSVLTSSLPDGVVGVPYSFALAAVGAPSGVTWALDSGSSLPDGLSLTSDGMIRGTPTKVVTSSFVVVAQSGDLAARAGLVLRVNDMSGPLQILTHSLPTAVAGTSYSAKLAAVGGMRPYTWTLVDGTLPNGLHLSTNGDGTVSGTPTQTAATTPAGVTFRVTDALGAWTTAQVNLRVVTSSSLRIITDVLPGGFVGQNYPPAGTDNSVLVVHGTAPYTYTVSAGALPPGLTHVDNADRTQIQGKPQAAGLYTFTLQVTDSTGQMDEHDYAIVVQVQSLSLAPLSLPSCKPGDTYDADLSSISARAKWAIYSGALPPGITLDPGGHLGGKCADDATGGAYAFVIQATDTSGATGVVAESITVVPTEHKAPGKTGCQSSGPGPMLLSLLALMGLGLRRSRRGLAALATAGALAAPGAAHAGYNVSQSGTSYTAITGGSTITSGSGSAGNVSLPFNFRFFGQSYNSVSVGTSGYLVFSGSATSSGASLGGQPAIAAWMDGLTEDSFNGGSLTYVVAGSAPSREVIIQWQNADNIEDEQFDFVETQFNFQIHLHETGRIDVVYGGQGQSGFFSNATAGISDGQGTNVFLLSCANSGGSCTQSNWPSNQQFVLTNGPDLVVNGLSGPGLAYAGTNVSVSATVSNVGGEDAANVTARFYVSSDRVFGNADDQPVAEVTGLTMTSQAQQQISQSFSLGSRPPGTYYLFCKVDPDDTVGEDNEDNNLAGPDRLDIGNPAPDLSVDGVIASVHAGQGGTPVSVAFTVHNSGTVPSDAVDYAVYLSANPVISQGDTQLVRGSLPAINGGVDSNQNASVTLPDNLAPGSYYLGVVVDPDGTLVESDKLNNSAGDPTALVVAGGALALVAPAGNKLPDTTVGAVYGYQLTATGGDGTYSFSASAALPPGLSLSDSGSLSGRPGQAGSFTVKVDVVDGSGASAAGNYTLTVASGDLPLVVLSRDLPAASYAQPYSSALAAIGGHPPYVWTLAEGKLPGGVVLGADGTLEGVPREAGDFNFTAQVQDSAATPNVGSVALKLSVASPERLKVASTELPNATLGQPYEVVLGVAGGNGPYYWDFPYCNGQAGCPTVTRFPMLPTDPVPAPSSDLPRGFYFSCDAAGNAVLTTNPLSDGPCPTTLPPEAPRVPVEAGIFSIPAHIHDSTAGSALETVVTYTITVGFGQGPTITTTRPPDALEGKDYSFQLLALSPDSPQKLADPKNPASASPVLHWTLACSERNDQGQPVTPCPEGLPPGLTLDDTGLLKGKASDTALKSYTFLVRVGDDQNRAEVQAMTLTVRPALDTSKKTTGCTSAPGDLGTLLGLAGLALRRRRARRETCEH